MQQVVHIDHNGSHGVPPIHSHGGHEPRRHAGHEWVVALCALVVALVLMALVANGRAPKSAEPLEDHGQVSAPRRTADRPGTTGEVAGHILGSAAGRDAQSHMLEEEDVPGNRPLQ